MLSQVGRPNLTKDGREVRTVKVADKTGSINLSLWDEPGKLVQSGDIVRMTRAYLNVWKGCLTLYLGKGGELARVGDFCLVFAEQPFLSEYSAEYAAMREAERQGGGGGGGAGGGGGGGGQGKGRGGGMANSSSNGGGGGGANASAPSSAPGGGGGGYSEQRRFPANGGGGGWGGGGGGGRGGGGGGMHPGGGRGGGGKDKPR